MANVLPIAAMLSVAGVPEVIFFLEARHDPQISFGPISFVFSKGEPKDRKASEPGNIFVARRGQET